jgi:hypothetical protein
VGTGQPPAVYYQLTIVERNAFIEAVNRRNRQKSM